MNYLTGFEDVDGVLGVLLAEVKAILKDNFVGMYLYGSLVTGDFSLETSDVDFLVAMREPIDGEVVKELGEMHGRLAASESKWGQELEGYYLHLAALRCFVRSNEEHPHRERGEALKVEPLAEDSIIMRHILWHKGVALAGPPVREFIDFVPDDDLREAVRDLFVGWWRPMVTNHSKLEWYGYRAYAVTTMCRMLYTLRFGKVVSKKTAGEWAMTTLTVPWRGLVATAVNEPWEDIGGVDEVVEFIRFVDGEM